jgi:hypothetical protein
MQKMVERKRRHSMEENYKLFKCNKLTYVRKTLPRVRITRDG